MKKNFFLVFAAIFILILPAVGQIGINTENPLATLDVNGNLRIRTVKPNTTSKNILVMGDDGEIQTSTIESLSPGAGVSPRKIISAVRVSAASSYVLQVSLLGGWGTIPFTSEEFDFHNDFNTSTYQFTTPVTGIYDFDVQFTARSLLSLGTVSLAIWRKTSATSVETLAQTDLALSLSLVGIGIPLNIKTLLPLNAGDVISFGAKIPALNLGLLGGDNAKVTIIQAN